MGLLREVGLLCKVVPHVEMTLSANGELTFFVNTDITQLYSLCTVPIKWTRLKESNKNIHTLFMEAGQQALNPQLSRFVICKDNEMAWQADDLFGCWVKAMTEKRQLVETIVWELVSTLGREKGDRPSLLCWFFFYYFKKMLP